MGSQLDLELKIPTAQVMETLNNQMEQTELLLGKVLILEGKVREQDKVIERLVSKEDY